MLIHPVLLVIMSLLFIVAVFGAPVWLLLRLVSVRSDTDRITEKITRLTIETTKIIENDIVNTKKFADISGRLDTVDMRNLATEETIRNLINKMNSRERAEQRREKRELDEAAAREEVNTAPEIPPGFEQMIMPLFGDQQQKNSVSTGQAVKQRRFGELP